jgi:hypothetical protein
MHTIGQKWSADFKFRSDHIYSHSHDPNRAHVQKQNPHPIQKEQDPQSSLYVLIDRGQYNLNNMQKATLVREVAQNMKVQCFGVTRRILRGKIRIKSMNQGLDDA